MREITLSHRSFFRFLHLCLIRKQLPLELRRLILMDFTVVNWQWNESPDELRDVLFHPRTWQTFKDRVHQLTCTQIYGSMTIYHTWELRTERAEFVSSRNPLCMIEYPENGTYVFITQKCAVSLFPFSEMQTFADWKYCVYVPWDMPTEKWTSFYHWLQEGIRPFMFIDNTPRRDPLGTVSDACYRIYRDWISVHFNQEPHLSKPDFEHVMQDLFPTVPWLPEQSRYPFISLEPWENLNPPQKLVWIEYKVPLKKADELYGVFPDFSNLEGLLLQFAQLVYQQLFFPKKKTWL